MNINVSGILDYSLELKSGEKVFIFADLNSLEYCNLISSKIIERGAIPLILWNDFSLNRALVSIKDENMYEEMFSNCPKLHIDISSWFAGGAKSSNINHNSKFVKV